MAGQVVAKAPSAGLLGSASAVFQFFILLAICVLAFSTRLFSVLRYESVIHEFDPYFNYRATKYLVSEGFYEFHNWFDSMTWFPLGRHVGQTTYPGLLWTSAILYKLAHALHIPIDIRNICVFMGPLMASNTCLAVFGLTTECWNSHAGLFAAAFVALAPGYISRSVAGSYDYEAVAIFAMILVFFLWVKAVKTGSMLWASLSALAYFYMAASWGGYIFVINLIPWHVLLLILAGRFTPRLYVAYSTYYILGTILSMQVTMIQFIPISSPEHLGALGVFLLCQVLTIVQWLGTLLTPQQLTLFIRHALKVAVPTVLVLGTIAMALGYFPQLTGRLLSLIGASKNIAIVKSVSEHQPTPWTSFFFDLHLLVVLAPCGLWYSMKEATDGSLFLFMYAFFSVYFAGIMIRLMLVIAPIFCVLAGVAASESLTTVMGLLVKPVSEESLAAAGDEKSASDSSSKKKSSSSLGGVANAVASGADLDETVEACAGFAIVAVFAALCYLFVIHCTWVTSMAYSSPSVVLSAQQHDGSKIIFDDFREAYYWMSHNTRPDDKIMSWWDYGYQITAMSNRTTIVDNNTRNNTHIATVGMAMASTEENAYPVLRRLGVNYVLVVFGGFVGYSSDDINKFLWMIRIGGGVFPQIVEADFYNSNGEFRVDSAGSSTLHNSLMYTMCYYRFGEAMTEYGQPTGYDRVRRAEIARKSIQLKHLEEAFTSEHWMVRIYRVLEPDQRPASINVSKNNAAQARRSAQREGRREQRRKARLQAKAAK